MSSARSMGWSSRWSKVGIRDDATDVLVVESWRAAPPGPRWALTPAPTEGVTLHHLLFDPAPPTQGPFIGGAPGRRVGSSVAPLGRRVGRPPGRPGHEPGPTRCARPEPRAARPMSMPLTALPGAG